MEESEIKQQILEYLYKEGESCTYCGKRRSSIAVDLNIEASLVIKLLNEMYLDKQIVVRKAIGGPLVFLNYSNYERVSSNT